MKKFSLKDFRPVDILLLTYCAMMLTLIALFGYNLEKRSLITIIYLSSIIYTLICIYLRTLSRKFIARLLINLYPLLPLVGFYEVSGFQLHIFFNGFFDSTLLKIENTIFSIHPTLWLQRFNHPLFTEWMMFGYTMYLFLLPITVATLFIKKKHEESSHLVFSLMLSFFLCYIGFILLPVEGPRFVLKSQYTVVFHGYLFKAFADLIEKNAMIHGGCFPSAHCAAATVMLVLSYRYDKKLFYIITPLILTLYVSTVYGRYHYPLDVIGGIITGLIGIKLSYPLQTWWENIVKAKYKDYSNFARQGIPQEVDAQLDRD